MGRKVADQLVETLCRAGVKRIYAVTGDSLNEVNDAVRRAGTVGWVHVRHEETGAFAAGAEAQLNGVACCAGSSRVESSRVEWSGARRLRDGTPISSSGRRTHNRGWVFVR